jgi:multicomponent Na+:H+ antiporter subunit D
VDDIAAILTAAATTAICSVVLVRSSSSTQLHWFGGWQPRRGVALGIDFAVDPIGAGLALLASVLVTAALVFSWRYFDEAGKLFHVLVLVFLGGMCGFAYTGDLFNLFVFFELMGIAAFALTAFNVEETGPVQGALNFAITNTVGALLVLTGIALLYGRTGALNLAQLGNALAGREADGLVVVSFTLLACGFLVKAAAFPFHFWLPDAYAVAPAPVCALFAGVMSDLGLYALARVYWTVFSGPLGAHADAIRAVLLGVGVATALVGSTMCLVQRHVKRLLAHSTVAHTGLFLVGIATLDPKGTAGAALWIVSHGLLKGALFFAAGIVLNELGDADELRLRGRGRELRVAGVVFALGALGLAGLPFVGSFSGHSLVEEAVRGVGAGWSVAVLVVASAVTSGAILRAAARIFLGWGADEDPLLSPEPREDPAGEPRRAARPLMNAAALALLALGLAVSVVPGLEHAAESAADSFQNREGYAAVVLRGAVEFHESVPVEVPIAPASSILLGLLSAAGAVGVAALALRPRRRRVNEALARPLAPLKAIHSGVVTDYVAWTTFGTALVGGLFALLLR